MTETNSKNRISFIHNCNEIDFQTWSSIPRIGDTVILGDPLNRRAYQVDKVRWDEEFGATHLSMQRVEINLISKQIWQHIKRGTSYRILHSNITIEATMEKAVVYQDVNSRKIWVRPESEFFDGRFQLVVGGEFG